MKRIATLLLLCSTLALGQDLTPPPMPPPEPSPTAPPPLPVESRATPRGVPPNLGNALLTDPGNRFRWGVSGNLGAMAPTSGFTPALGVDARFGWQFTNNFSAYAILGFIAGLQFASQTGIGNAQFNQYLGAEAEWIFGDLFFVAGGPVVSNVAYAATLVNTGLPGISSLDVRASGARFAFDARAGFHLGSVNPKNFRRGGFSVALSAMTTIYGDASITQNRIDGTSSTSTGLAVGVVPMLMLGFDAR